MLLGWIHSLLFSNTQRNGDKSSCSVHAPILVLYLFHVVMGLEETLQPASLPGRMLTGVFTAVLGEQNLQQQDNLQQWDQYKARNK